jgi:cytochrome c
MSLAMFAAPFDQNSNIDSFTNNNDNNIINQKRQLHNKTQKKYPKENFDQNKVNSVLEKIHNNLDEDDDNDNFSHPPKPE